MGYKKLFSVLSDNASDEKIKSLIHNLSSGYVDIPYIMSETMKILDDDNPFCNIIPDKNKKALCFMLQSYFNTCWGEYIEDTDLNKLLKYGKIEVYKIDAANGLRYATEKEVALGIKGLMGEYIYPAGEDAYRKLCLLNWTFTGKGYFYKQAGYDLKYDKDGKVITTLYEMIQASALEIKELFTWVESEEYEQALKKIKKFQKSKGYKYASSEKDEITESITIKQLVYNVYNTFPRNSPNPNYRKALSLSIKSVVDKKTLTPLEISRLREIYDEFALDRNRGNVGDDSISEALKKNCEMLLNERYKGKVNKNHFAFTIIETLKKNNYNKCSPKQYSIIEDALAKLELNRDGNQTQLQTEKTATEVAEVISDSDVDLTLANLSDAIGDGLFDD